MSRKIACESMRKPHPRPRLQCFLTTNRKVLECTNNYFSESRASWHPDDARAPGPRLPRQSVGERAGSAAFRIGPESSTAGVPKGEVESACKPGSVRLATRQSFLSARRRHLAPATYPGTTRAALSFPYLVLLRVGFTVPYGVGPVRGALLPHPFTLACALAGHRRSALCCTGRQLALPRSCLALCPVEPGLSSMRSSRDATVRPTPMPV